MDEGLAHIRTLMLEGYYDLALAQLQNRLIQTPHDALPYAWSSICLLALNRPTEGLGNINRAIDLAPQTGYYRYCQAKIYYAIDGHAEALKSIQRAIALDPSDAENHALLSAIYYDYGQLGASLRSAEMGLKLDPNHLGCLDLRFLSLFHTHRSPAETGAATPPGRMLKRAQQQEQSIATTVMPPDLAPASFTPPTPAAASPSPMPRPSGQPVPSAFGPPQAPRSTHWFWLISIGFILASFVYLLIPVLSQWETVTDQIHQLLDP